MPRGRVRKGTSSRSGAGLVGASAAAVVKAAAREAEQRKREERQAQQAAERAVEKERRREEEETERRFWAVAQLAGSAILAAAQLATLALWRGLARPMAAYALGTSRKGPGPRAYQEAAVRR